MGDESPEAVTLLVPAPGFRRERKAEDMGVTELKSGTFPDPHSCHYQLCLTCSSSDTIGNGCRGKQPPCLVTASSWVSTQPITYG